MPRSHATVVLVLVLVLVALCCWSRIARHLRSLICLCIPAAECSKFHWLTLAKTPLLNSALAIGLTIPILPSGR
ncbi:hypothetical protein FN846DRAFT_982348 [Sphaerosporella brunnea]|uniref:Secreted protein n=1 Tax=Sphaerosporella brunnea TaxID=1250544 RepID=A0A5J5EBN3_9PEZI|nr:hypothetical protein FN846DRAFT_982348 [Sphaerosporella brunnea]